MHPYTSLATFSTEVLALERNILVGSIPTSVGELSNLKEVLLQGNLMTGSIPAEIVNLINLGKLQ
jgi:Leucine-rich repeat (LRR) protein